VFIKKHNISINVKMSPTEIDITINDTLYLTWRYYRKNNTIFCNGSALLDRFYYINPIIFTNNDKNQWVSKYIRQAPVVTSLIENNVIFKNNNDEFQLTTSILLQLL